MGERKRVVVKSRRAPDVPQPLIHDGGNTRPSTATIVISKYGNVMGDDEFLHLSVLSAIA